MKHFTSIHDIKDPISLINQAIELKDNTKQLSIGKNKTIGLLFFNSSLRTRMSTQKAAQNLGMEVMLLNVTNDSWALEYEEGAVMNGNTIEHIKDAATVMGLYCDILAIRCFPNLQNKEEDYQDKIINQFIQYAKVPIVSLESATRHPLQSLADMMTIQEHKNKIKPKIVLTWAPHIKPIPQVVANSFAEWTLACGYDLTITHPKDYELSQEFTKGARIEYDQERALQDADFVYVKNWSSYTNYGKVLPVQENWMLTNQKLNVTNSAKIMHCLPVRRNVELSDEVLDSKNSLILEQAQNRVYAAQIVLKKILETNF
ncbi:N-acetylornithine carbamoyltransferase [Flavobacterium oreochromis]|uniref:N-succinylornithine carbamoyltransferase n=1 Tax=Flavobacterium columnare TaxID=996 RepID=A0A246G8E4_9FLAO|nr:N-acetylornithine carbamoyltransferase [Flavobacterium oreochromis]OWP75131.1 acetylornithine carbamoyltransferase [Flavobacterium oreochromis]POR24221.1 acetylornithine carbamoyltransferase [Flavobacterium columnare]QYS87341.1 N-acetylornithine carbamoyltransferase [Flavobacterium oreochromis]